MRSQLFNEGRDFIWITAKNLILIRSEACEKWGDLFELIFLFISSVPDIKLGSFPNPHSDLRAFPNVDVIWITRWRVIMCHAHLKPTWNSFTCCLSPIQISSQRHRNAVPNNIECSTSTSQCAVSPNPNASCSTPQSCQSLNNYCYIIHTIPPAIKHLQCNYWYFFHIKSRMTWSFLNHLSRSLLSL